MPKISQCLRIRSKLTQLKKLDNNLIAISTRMHGAKIFSYDDCHTESNITHEYLNPESSAITFSPNGDFLAFNFKSLIYILHIASKVLIKTIKIDNETVDLMEFDPESKYIIVATNSGRILQYRYDGSSMLARLYSFEVDKNKTKTAICSFAFYKNIMASGGNNGKIFTINLHSRANKLVIDNKCSAINSICFLDENNIVSGDSKGYLFFTSLKENKLLKRIETGFTKIKQIVLMPNKDYIITVGDAKHLSIYSTKTFKLLHNKYIKFNSTIDKVIVTDDNTLLISLDSGIIQKVILQSAAQLKAFILHNSLDKAYEIVQKDAMLKDTKEFKELEKAYEGIYNKAAKSLAEQNKDKAIELTNMFKHVDSKKDDIKLLFKAFEYYPRLKSLYMEKKYPLAYALCFKYPPLTKTLQYTKMEEIFREVFKNAQRQIAHGIIDNAKTLLNEYVTVAQKRPIIKLILNDNENFIGFLKAIEAKDFQKIEKIVKTNKLFVDIPTYKNILEDMTKALLDIQIDINNSNITSATKKISQLQGIDSISSKINTLKNECIAVTKLQNAYDLNDFTKCYEILDTHSFLSNTELGSLLQRHWFDLISKCEEFALEGNVRDIIASLGELISLETRRDKIGDLLRLSFHTKINGLLAQKDYKISENIIYSYIDIFGLDSEIISIMKLHERVSSTKLAITQNQDSRKDRDSWIYSEVIMGS